MMVWPSHSDEDGDLMVLVVLAVMIMVMVMMMVMVMVMVMVLAELKHGTTITTIFGREVVVVMPPETLNIVYLPSFNY